MPSATKTNAQPRATYNPSPNILTWLETRPEDALLPAEKRPVVKKTYGLVAGKIALVAEPKFPTFWHAQEIPVTNIDDVLEAMVARRNNSGCFIPGGLANSARTHSIRRSGGPVLSQDKHIWDVPRAVFWLDLDSAPLYSGDVTQMSWEEIEDHISGGVLRKIIGDCDRIIHLSNSCLTKPGLLKGHIIVLADKGLTKTDRHALIGEFRQIKIKKAVASGLLDESVNRLAQPLFTSDPTFVGVDDPLAGTHLESRFHIIRGKHSKMQVPPRIELQRRAAIYETRVASIKGTGFSNTTAKDVDASLGGADDDPRWARIIAGLGGSFHDEMLLAIRSYAHLHGVADDGAELFSRWDIAADTTIKQARGEAYAEGSKKRIKSAYVDWLRALKRERGPQLVPYEPDIPEVSLAEGTRLIEDLSSRLEDTAVRLHQARVKHRRAVAEVEAAQAAGDLNLARRLAVHHKILQVDPDFTLQTISDNEGWSVVSVDMFEDSPFLPKLHAGLKASVSLGKTRALVRAALRCARRGMRAVLNVNAHALGQQFVDDLKRVDDADRGTNAPIKIAIWRGTSQPDPSPAPENIAKTTCARSEERSALARAGQGGDWLCGTKKRGFCPHHPKAKGSCLYQRQRAAVQEAQVIVCAGAPMLAKDPPMWFSPPAKKFLVVDPATGKETKIKATYEPPLVDLFIADELNALGLVEGEVETKRGQPRSCEAPVSELVSWAALAEHDLPLELQQNAEATVETAADRFRDAFPDAQNAIRAVAEAAGAYSDAGDLLTYRSVREAAGGRTGKASSDYVHRLIEKMWGGKLPCSADPSDSAAVAAWLAGPAGEWNRRLVTITKVLKGVARALERHQGAADEKRTGYLRASPLGEHGQLGMGLTARKVSNIKKAWLGGAAVFLDATWQAELAARFLPSVTEVVHANVPVAQSSAFVTQTWDISLNMTKMDELIKEAAAGKPRRLAQLARWVELESLRLTGRGKEVDGASPDLLVLCSRKLEQALKDHWGPRMPKNILLWHYGAVRGLNAARGVAGLVALGRVMPSAEAIADLRSIIDGEPAELPIAYVQVDGEWRSNADRQQAWKYRRRRTTVADSLGSAILESVTYAELEQAIVGRARLLRREGESVEVTVIGAPPVNGLFVDRLVKTAELMRRVKNPALELLSRSADLEGLGRNKKTWISQDCLGVSPRSSQEKEAADEEKQLRSFEIKIGTTSL
jgi:hypothetical protein